MDMRIPAQRHTNIEKSGMLWRQSSVLKVWKKNYVVITKESLMFWCSLSEKKSSSPNPSMLHQSKIQSALLMKALENDKEVTCRIWCRYASESDSSPEDVLALKKVHDVAQNFMAHLQN